MLMALTYQGFFDESQSSDEFIIGGHIATEETWASFSRDWAEILEMGIRSEDGTYHFKMSEMAQNEERMLRARHFYKIIERHNLISVSARVNIGSFKRAFDRVSFDLVNIFRLHTAFGMWGNPYYICFRALIDGIHHNRESISHIVPVTEKINFIFDERSEKKEIVAAWDDIVQQADEKAQRLVGATPRFENDRVFLPLQAADLWAWWVREWYEEEEAEIPQKMKNFDFGTWKGSKRKFIVVTTSETQIAKSLMGNALYAARGG